MNPFVDPKRVFYNTVQQNNIEMQIRNTTPDMLSSLKLKQFLPEHKFNQYRDLYGDDPFKATLKPEYIRPPIEANAAFWAVYPIPYTINHTRNKLVDIAGTYYINETLPVMQNRL